MSFSGNSTAVRQQSSRYQQVSLYSLTLYFHNIRWIAESVKAPKINKLKSRPWRNLITVTVNLDTVKKQKDEEERLKNLSIDTTKFVATAAIRSEIIINSFIMK